VAAAASVLQAETAAGVEFFEKQVRPLLAAQCYACHSAKVKAPFAGLRLDTPSGIRNGADNGPVVVAGDPGASRLIRAVRGELAAKMPPSGPMKAEQIHVLEHWVKMGAPLPEAAEQARSSAVSFDLEQRRREHWVWQPVRKVAPPAVRNANWPLQDLDRFLLARMEAAGLEPAPAADPATLIRRLSFDLHGLPPDPAEVDAFVSNPGSYEAVVDRFLTSPRFGERWARHWMDLVRYSESHGSEGDPDTPYAWRYRDYLIRALNNDVPYDQLIREHLAGDLLAAPRVDPSTHTNESILGTAHLRMVEHGFQPVDPWEDRVKWMDNQIDVFSKAFQGLTISCARCHDHKFDAISQKDFYALFGTLYGARPTQRAIDTDEHLALHRERLAELKKQLRDGLARTWLSAEPPGLPFAEFKELEGKEGESLRQAWEALASRWRAEIASRKAFNAKRFGQIWDLRRGFGSWLRHGTGIGDGVSPPGEFAVLPTGGRILSGIYPGGVYSHLISSKHNGVISSPRFKIETDSISLRSLGGNFSFAQLIIENYAVPRGGIYHLRYSPKTDSMGWSRWDTSFWRGFTAYIEFATQGDVTHFLPDEQDQKEKRKPEGRDRSYFGAQAVAFHNGKETPKEETVPFALLLDGPAPSSQEEWRGRWRKLLRDSIEAWRKGTMSEAEAAWLDAFVRAGMLPNSTELEPLKAIVDEYRRLEAEVPVARRAPSVLEEPASPQPLLVRGNHKSFGPVVPQRYLAALGGAEYEDRREARLRLAEEVASARNPLTARVMVNRIWARLFGRGLVATVDNFGKLGDKPTHPELLDWLAARFVEDGWSIRKAIRMMVTSRAYRMSSTAPARSRAADPANRLLSHMPVRRLDAESIRDAMLAVSGRLDLKMYGPSVAVYYAHETGKTKGDKPKGPLDGDGRRSVYLEIRRNATNPFLEVWDVPKPSTTRGERDRTNVPAQSLALLNSPFVIGQAARWGESLTAGGEPAEKRVDRMYRRAFGRPASAAERDRALSFLAEAARERGAEAESAGAWADLAQSLFNLKEFIYVR